MMGTTLRLDLDIAGITADSRAVGPGYLFAALVGTKADGRDFVPAAIQAGAQAVLAPEGSRLDLPGNVLLLTDPNPRRRYALLAAAFHGAQPDHMVAVTGTNGKTSTAVFFRRIMEVLGKKAAAIGTLGVIAPGWDNQGGLTTPDAGTLHQTLASLKALGVDHGCMEASSHGLDQYRLDGVRIQAAAFTNLSRDHLDYHGDMEAYLKAKTRLFLEVMEPGGVMVINADIPEHAALEACALLQFHRVYSYGRGGQAIRLLECRPQADGQILELEVLGRHYRVRLPLAGSFQAMNALAALGLALAVEADTASAVSALEQLEEVPGRMQRVAVRANGAAIYVDYAHTPDALETVLKALKPHAARRLVVVFGCGGDRDPGKRPIMGRIACRLADAMVVTDDNPRSENPEAIRAAVRGACPGAIEIADRREAIRVAVAGLQTGDVLLLAGKGHESGQIVGDSILPFSDADEALAAVALADGGAS